MAYGRFLHTYGGKKSVTAIESFFGYAVQKNVRVVRFYLFKRSKDQV